MEEVWRTVEGTNGLYEVSNRGRVKSNHFGKARILKCGIMADGYENVQIFMDGRRKSRKVHRLVAEAFLDNPDGLPVVNHIDENPRNNCVENLEWCTQKHNLNHGTSRQRKSKAIRQYDKSRKLLAEFYGGREAERKTGVSSRHICDCCRGERPSAGGYIWEYAKNP